MFRPKGALTPANDGDGARSYAGAQQSSRTNYESKHRERLRAAPARPGWANPVPPEADATPETRLPFVPQVRSVPDLTTVSQDTAMYASMFEPLNRSLETNITKLSKSTERGERSREVKEDTQKAEVIHGRVRWLHLYLDRGDEVSF